MQALIIIFISENESIKAINTLKKSTTPKIQKIQLMKTYFKDYKAKMLKEEEEINHDTNINFEGGQDDVSKGKFFKKKVQNSSSSSGNNFLFNFSNESSVNELTNEIEKL